MRMNTAPAEYRIIRIFLWMVLIAYMLVLTKMILVKQGPGFVKRQILHNWTWSKVKKHAKEGNYTLFATVKLYLRSSRTDYSIPNLGGNIVGFIPLGFLLPSLFKGLRRGWKVMLVTFFVSLGFEGTQLLTLLGSFDVDDLLLNTIGGTLGYLFFLLFYYVSFRRRIPAPVPVS